MPGSDTDWFSCSPSIVMKPPQYQLQHFLNRKALSISSSEPVHMFQTSDEKPERVKGRDLKECFFRRVTEEANSSAMTNTTLHLIPKIQNS